VHFLWSYYLLQSHCLHLVSFPQVQNYFSSTIHGLWA
jgi:hypothetical protein